MRLPVILLIHITLKLRNSLIFQVLWIKSVLCLVMVCFFFSIFFFFQFCYLCQRSCINNLITHNLVSLLNPIFYEATVAFMGKKYEWRGALFLLICAWPHCYNLTKIICIWLKKGFGILYHKPGLFSNWSNFVLEGAQISQCENAETKVDGGSFKYFRVELKSSVSIEVTDKKGTALLLSLLHASSW